MAQFEVGDLVVLKSGSMRMVVEEVSDAEICTVWCNEGVIGRDRFSPLLLNKWEYREDKPADRAPRRSASDDDRPARAPRRSDDDRPARAPRRSAGDDDRPARSPRSRASDDDRPPRKYGFDGKPREKKHFRKDD